MTTDDSAAQSTRTVKARMRLAALQAREALSKETRLAASDALAATLLDHPLVAMLAPGRVLVPTEHRDEVPTRPVARRLELAGWEICRPRVDRSDRSIDVVPWPIDMPLVPGYAGVPEPPDDALGVDATTLCLVLVPGALFDRRGCRLGYGQGFFDAFLAQVPAATRIGIGHESQLSADLIPLEPHDVSMQGLQLGALSVVCGAQST